MKITGKQVLIVVYILLALSIGYLVSSNPTFKQYLKDYMSYVESLGHVGMAIFVLTSATMMTMMLPFQFIDILGAITYPLNWAIFLLILSKLVGAAQTYFVANYFMSEDTKKEYLANKYLKCMQELIK